MIHLTKEEKANRYDSLQVAIKHTIDSYKRRRDASEKSYRDAQDVGIIGAYQKGLSDGYSLVVADMERWIE